MNFGRPTNNISFKKERKKNKIKIKILNVKV
jgi:hypothetical protein